MNFSCVFGSSGFYPSCHLFTVLMLDGRQAYTVLNCKALSLLNTVMWWHVSATLLFLPQHIIFSKNIVLCAMSATQHFFEKNNVLWQKK